MSPEGILLHDTAHNIGRIRKQVEIMVKLDSNHIISDQIRKRLETIDKEALNIKRLLDEYYNKIHKS
jgi:hypothetical protein